MEETQQKAIAPVDQAGDRFANNNLASHFSQGKKFQRSGTHRPCPICGRMKDTDCGWNLSVAFCHTHVDHDAGVDGYVYRGREDIWGLYFPKPPLKPTRAKSRKEFVYQDSEGQPLVRVTRCDDGQGQKQIFQSNWDGQQWVKGLTSEIKQRLRLYQIAHPLNQDAIAQNQQILIVEGEGKVELLLKLGVAATSAIGGAGKWKGYGYPNYLQDLAGAKVVLCPDQDEPGLRHCQEVEQDFPDARWLYAFPDSLHWSNLPKKEGLDIADWVAAENLTAEQILVAIEPKRDLLPNEADAEDAGSTDSPKNTLGQLLLQIAADATYFHTPDQRVYADIIVGGVRQTYPVRKKVFKQWLQHELFKRHGKPVGAETLNQVLGVLEARGNFEGEEQTIYLRVAELEGTVYLDLGTQDWQAVEVSAEGWRIVSDYPVRFRRPDNLMSLPCPISGGSLSELRRLLNLDDDAWTLTITWLLFSLYPKYPHPILILYGEQGAGKSYTARILRGLVDPGKAPLIPSIADLRNLAIAAENRWILAYDNLSGLSADQSDALCRISTGGGFTIRTLYENDEETVFEFIRPQILTGIDSLATRGDLLERALLVKLPTISPEKRRTEAELEQTLNRLKPGVLGALLDALSQTLKALPSTQPDQLPRMADFVRFAIAAEPALGLPAGSFSKAYLGNQQEAHETALDASPVATAIQRFMTSRQTWQGTPTELLQELEQLVDEKTLKSKSWAGNARSLGKALTRLAPNLRGIGLVVNFTRTSNHRLIQIERTLMQTSQTSLTSESSLETAFDCDMTETLSDEQQSAIVTHDMTTETGWQTSQLLQENVTAGDTASQRVQKACDDDDVCDMAQACESSWIGKSVRKQGKAGWRGSVQFVQGNVAEVLWQGDKTPTSVMLSDLEEVA